MSTDGYHRIDKWGDTMSIDNSPGPAISSHYPFPRIIVRGAQWTDILTTRRQTALEACILTEEMYAKICDLGDLQIR